MNNKCNNCAKFLTCNQKECKKISFIQAGILDRPKIKKILEVQERIICQ